MKIVFVILAWCVLSSASVAAQERCAPASATTRLAVAGGSITEIIFALGLESKLVAVDRTSNFPEAANQLPSVGYVRNVSAEGLISLSPTLVLGEDDMGPPATVKQIRSMGIEVRQIPEVHTADGIVDKVRCVASILGVDGEAEKYIEKELLPAVSALAAKTGNGSRTVLLFGLRDGVPMIAGRETSGNGLLAMAGATNVFAEIRGWKPVSLEAMARADPHVIVIPERGVRAAGGIDKVLAHPSIRLTTAASTRRIIAMDGMTLLGFGPRTLQAALRLATEL